MEVNGRRDTKAHSFSPILCVSVSLHSFKNQNIMKIYFTLLLLQCSLFSFSQIQFNDVAISAGVGEDGTNYGASVGDFNNDGWDDIYVTRTPGPNRLFKNNGDGTFSDVAVAAGVDFEESTRISLWGDINNDGCLDLFLANSLGINDKLYLNNCDETFEDISIAAGIEDDHLPQAAIMGDVDNDGFLDIYLAHQDGQNVLWRNNGDNTFSDETEMRGVTDNLIAMGAIFFDYDNDLDLDLYLVHDGYGPNILYKNSGNGYFVDVAIQSNTNVSAFGMGVDFGDINNDGWLDLYITNQYENVLLLNNGDPHNFGIITFTDITLQAGDDLNNNGMGWGISFADIDNDALQDFYFSNTSGYPNVLFHNKGNNQFVDVSSNTILASGGNNFAIASLDYNNDGKVDFFVSSSISSSGNHLFKNESQNPNHWVKVKPIGTVSNRSGIGARVEVAIGDTKCVDIVTGGSGWSSQNSLALHFGLGDATMIDTLKVMWQSGITDILTNVAVDETYTIVEGEHIVTSVNELLDNDFEIKIYPNPVRDVALIEFDNPEAGEVSIQVFDVNWEIIYLIDKKKFSKGKQVVEWKNDEIENGFYFLKIEGKGFNGIKKLVLLD